MEALSNRISVILPVKRWRCSTATAIRSVLDQSHRDIELLLIGQTSISSLADKLNDAGIRDTRIRLIARTQPGITGALNTGLEHAQGKFIARMDDDDIAYADRLTTQLRFLTENPRILLCAGKVRFIDSAGSHLGVGQGNQRYAHWLNNLTEPAEIALACYAENPMPHPTLLAHRNVWQRLNGYRDFDGPEDHDLILRAMQQGIRMGKPGNIILDWREHSSRLTHTDSRYRRQAFIALAARTLSLSDHELHKRAKQGVWIAGTGKSARHWHDELMSCGIAVTGFVDMSRPGDDRRKRNLPVITYEQLASVRKKELIISAVSQPSARSAVKQFCTRQCWQEGLDFITGC